VRQVKIISDSTGVLVVPPFDDLASGRIKLSFAEHDAKILFFLTYFDNVAVVPFNVAAADIWMSTELEQTLVEQQIIKVAMPPEINQGNGRSWNTEFIAEVSEEIYSNVNSIEPGWALAGTTETLEHAAVDEANAVVMTLLGVLPAPAPSTALGDILAFRADNAKALTQMRHAINKLSMSFRAGVNDEDVRSIVETELMSQVELVGAAFEKKGIPFFRSDLSIGFAIPKLAVSAAAEWLASSLGASPGLGALIASGLSFNLGKSQLAREDNKHPRDFEYLLSGLRKGIMTIEGQGPFEDDIVVSKFVGNYYKPIYPKRITPPKQRFSSMSFSDNVLF
jgi:hypothetical protein